MDAIEGPTILDLIFPMLFSFGQAAVCETGDKVVYCQKSSGFAELKLRIGGSQLAIWVGCEPLDVNEPMPKLAFYLWEGH